ncbi:hypothetical protein TNCV_3553521 [Trichonephila clavipes]|nr:hypothetical protein TNCV_3553521 [Trichonephila clavipes]
MKATTLQSMVIGIEAMITNFFIPELNNHDVQELWFQQDGATCHTASVTIDLLKDTGRMVELSEICSVIEVAVDLEKHINLEVDSDDGQELLDSHNQELIIDGLIEMHKQEQDTEELESLD